MRSRVEAMTAEKELLTAQLAKVLMFGIGQGLFCRDICCCRGITSSVAHPDTAQTPIPSHFHLLWCMSVPGKSDNGFCADAPCVDVQLTQQQAEVAAALETKRQQVAAAAAKYKAIPQQLGGIATAGHSWNTQKAVPAM